MSHKDHKSKNQAEQLASLADAAQVQAQIASYQNIAQQLADSSSPNQDQEVLAGIFALDTATQVAFVQALAKEKNTTAADLLQAINNYATIKETRKEARRALIKLEGSNIYPEWAPPVISLFEPLANEEEDEDEDISHDLFSFLPPELANLLPGAQHENIVRDFLLAWGDGDYKTAFNNLASESPLREGLSRQQWVAKRQQWAEETYPEDFRALFAEVHNEGNDPGDATVEVSWSMIFRQDEAAATLPEIPTTTLLYPLTQRRWCWATYSFVQENGKLRIYDFVDEGAQALKLPVEELQQNIKELTEEAEEQFKDLQEAQSELKESLNEVEDWDEEEEVDEDIAEEEEEDEDIEDEEDEEEEDEFLDGSLANIMDRASEAFYLAGKSLHYRDALLTKEQPEDTLYTEAYELATVALDEERAAAYMQQMAENIPNKRPEALQKLASALILLSTNYDTEGDVEKTDFFLHNAETILREAITGNNVEPLSYVMLAQVLMSLNKPAAEAESLLQQALNSNPEPRTATLARVSLGRIAQEQENPQQALQYYEEAASISPDFPSIYTLLATAHTELEHIEMGEQNYLRALEADPDDAAAYAGLTFIYSAKMGDQERAESIAEQGLERNPESIELLTSMTKVCIAQGKLKEAEEYLEEAEDLDPDDQLVEDTRSLLVQAKALLRLRAPKPIKHKHPKRKK